MKNCSNCVNWCAHYIQIDDTSITSDVGECRRYPPVYGVKDIERFPMTSEDDWCGEFKSKKKIVSGIK